MRARDTADLIPPTYPRGTIGLGLFIVQHLVSAHGGTIDVSSNQLAGTCFTVRLPRTLTATAASASAE